MLHLDCESMNQRLTTILLVIVIVCQSALAAIGQHCVICPGDFAPSPTAGEGNTTASHASCTTCRSDGHQADVAPAFAWPTPADHHDDDCDHQDIELSFADLFHAAPAVEVHAPGDTSVVLELTLRADALSPYPLQNERLHTGARDRGGGQQHIAHQKSIRLNI